MADKESLVKRCDGLLDELKYSGFLCDDNLELLDLIIQILKIAPAVDLETFNP